MQLLSVKQDLKGVKHMIMQIALGIFTGFILLGALFFAVLAIAYVIGKEQEKPPKFLEKPKRNTKEWWDDDDI